MKPEPVIKKFKTQEQAKEELKVYFNEKKMKGRGPNKKEPNNNGYYEANIKKKTKVWTCDEMKKKPYTGSANNNYWFYFPPTSCISIKRIYFKKLFRLVNFRNYKGKIAKKNQVFGDPRSCPAGLKSCF